MATLDLPEDLQKRLSALAESSGRSEDSLLREAVQRIVEDMEDARAAEDALEAFEASGGRAVTLDAFLKSEGIGQEDLGAAEPLELHSD